MENSGGTEKNVTNSLLDKEINSMDAMVREVPTNEGY